MVYCSRCINTDVYKRQTYHRETGDQTGVPNDRQHDRQTIEYNWEFASYVEVGPNYLIFYLYILYL